MAAESLLGLAESWLATSANYFEAGGIAAVANAVWFTRGTDSGVTMAETTANLARLVDCYSKSCSGYDIRDSRVLHSPSMSYSIN